MKISSSDINPIDYGAMLQKVQDYERRFEQTDAQIRKLQDTVETLVALANTGRGGFWVCIAFVSVASSIVGYISHWFDKFH